MFIKNFYKRFKNIIFFVICLFCFSNIVFCQIEYLDLSAKSAIIIDIEQNKVLFKKKSYLKFPPASTTKVMTAILAIETLGLKNKVVPSKRVVQVEPTIIGLKYGVEYKVSDLIAAILIKSANDAAFVLAEAIAGSEKKFAELMNKKAKEIGMNNTHFLTSSGLPTGKKDKQYTTVEDLVKMMKYAIKYKFLLDVMSRKKAYIRGSDNKKLILSTHNKSLFSEKGKAWGKTGYTIEAKRTFVGVDPSFKPCIIFALLKSNDLWNDINVLKNEGVRFSKMDKKK